MVDVISSPLHSLPGDRGRERSETNTLRTTVWLCGADWLGLNASQRLFDDPHSGLAEILAWFFPLILWWTVGRLLFEQISLPPCFIGFCSFL